MVILAVDNGESRVEKTKWKVQHLAPCTQFHSIHEAVTTISTSKGNCQLGAENK
jgi:hypothetical protein